MWNRTTTILHPSPIRVDMEKYDKMSHASVPVKKQFSLSYDLESVRFLSHLKDSNRLERFLLVIHLSYN